MIYRAPSERPQFFRMNNASPLYNGLVFAGLGQHAGSTYYHDDSASKNNGTLIGYSNPSANWGWIQELNRFGFTAAAEAARISAGSIDFTVDYTLSAWVKITTSSACCLVSNLDGASGGSYVGTSVILAGKLETFVGGAFISGTTDCTNKLIHITIAKLGTAYTFYINGKVDVVRTRSGAATGVETTLAAYRNNSINYHMFNGKMADLCVWNRPLSQNAISALADPSNVDLRVGGVPMIQNIRKLWPVGGRSAALQKYQMTYRRRRTNT